MDPTEPSGWECVPLGLRSALKTLAETSAAMARRLSQVEEELEKERLKTTSSVARLLARVEGMERKSSAPPDKEATRRLVEECTRELEENLSREIDGARADAAATRAVATWRGASDELIEATVAAAIDKATP